MSLGRGYSETVVVQLVGFDPLGRLLLLIHSSRALNSKRNTLQFFVVNTSLSGTEPNRSQRGCKHFDALKLLTHTQQNV